LQILPVGSRERVVLLKSRSGRLFAVGVGSQSVTFITDLEQSDLQAPVAPPILPLPEDSDTTDRG
jgi:flagellar protein FliO/FliZ